MNQYELNEVELKIITDKIGRMFEKSTIHSIVMASNSKDSVSVSSGKNLAVFKIKAESLLQARAEIINLLLKNNFSVFSHNENETLFIQQHTPC